MLWWDVTSDSHGKGRTYFIHKRDVNNCVFPEGKEWQADYINNSTYFLLSVCVPSNFAVPPTKDVELILSLGRLCDLFRLMECDRVHRATDQKNFPA